MLTKMLGNRLLLASSVLFLRRRRICDKYSLSTAVNSRRTTRNSQMQVARLSDSVCGDVLTKLGTLHTQNLHLLPTITAQRFAPVRFLFRAIFLDLFCVECLLFSRVVARGSLTDSPHPSCRVVFSRPFPAFPSAVDSFPCYREDCVNLSPPRRRSQREGQSPTGSSLDQTRTDADASPRLQSRQSCLRLPTVEQDSMVTVAETIDWVVPERHRRACCSAFPHWTGLQAQVPPAHAANTGAQHQPPNAQVPRAELVESAIQLCVAWKRSS